VSISYSGEKMRNIIDVEMVKKIIKYRYTKGGVDFI